MGKLKVIFAGLVIAGVALVLALQYRANERLRRENESLRLTLADLKQSQDVREPVAAEDSTAKDQLAELLKLRGEVTQLRQQTNEVSSLREQNEKLRESVKTAAPVRLERPAKKSPQDALPQDIHPKATWTYRGYGTPDATMESVLSAMLSGDKAACLEGFSPEMRDQIDKQFESAVKNAKEDDQAEFRILDRQSLSDDEMVLTIYISHANANGEVEGHSEQTVFDRIGGEWKVTEKPAPSNSP